MLLYVYNLNEQIFIHFQMNQFVRVLNQHAVDPELIKQIFRQLYYFLGASALNNLLLRKEMCNWSKGMQIRYTGLLGNRPAPVTQSVGFQNMVLLD